jgi:sugar lactone lactonase YvrE
VEIVSSETHISPAALPHELELVAETDAHEGPVYAADEDALYFTTVRADRVAIKRLGLLTRTASVLRADANMANGMTFGPDGRLIVCEQGTPRTPARITAVDRATGAVEVLAEGGLSSPNDVVVGSDGAIWFTDPSYGWLQGFRPRPEHPDRVYRLDPSGSLEVVSEAFDKPNGLALSPDERILYVGDSGAIHAPGDYDPIRPRRVIALYLKPAGPTGPSNTMLQAVTLPQSRESGGPENASDTVSLGSTWLERTWADRANRADRADRANRADLADRVGGAVFADGIPGFPDGLKVASDGRVFVSAATGVLVFEPDGTPVGEIQLPGAVNFAFRPGESVLYVTADTAVWAVHLHTEGAPR